MRIGHLNKNIAGKYMNKDFIPLISRYVWDKCEYESHLRWSKIEIVKVRFIAGLSLEIIIFYNLHKRNNYWNHLMSVPEKWVIIECLIKICDWFRVKLIKNATLHEYCIVWVNNSWTTTLIYFHFKYSVKILIQYWQCSMANSSEKNPYYLLLMTIRNLPKIRW